MDEIKMKKKILFDSNFCLYLSFSFSFYHRLYLFSKVPSWMVRGWSEGGDMSSNFYSLNSALLFTKDQLFFRASSSDFPLALTHFFPLSDFAYSFPYCFLIHFFCLLFLWWWRHNNFLRCCIYLFSFALLSFFSSSYSLSLSLLYPKHLGEIKLWVSEREKDRNKCEAIRQISCKFHPEKKENWKEKRYSQSHGGKERRRKKKIKI